MKKLLSLSLILLIQCSKDPSSNNAGVYGFDNLEEAKENLGIYALAGELTNGSLSLNTDYTGFTDDDPQSFFFAKYVEDRFGGQSARIDGGTYSINDSINLEWNGSVYNAVDFEPQLSSDFVEELFGKTNKLSLTKDNTVLMSEELYFPSPLDVTNYSNEDFLPFSSLIGVNRNNFELEWNMDEHNPNGLLVYINWSGGKFNDGGISEHNKNVQNAMTFPDTGNFVCPASMFDNIGKDALVSVLIRRDNAIVVPQKNDESKNIKITASQTYYINLVLLD